MKRFISYWIFPAISGIIWLTTLLALLLYWLVATNQRHYPSMDDNARIAYISDVGASDLKPLFITGCVLTTIFLDVGFGLDRWLRHRGRLVRNEKRRERWFGGLGIAFALLGTAGLVLLSIFDTARYTRVHRVFLLLFVVGYLFSAVFLCWEYWHLGKANKAHRALRASFLLKLGFILTETVLVAIFTAMLFGVSTDAGAVLEWVIAFIFVFYILSFVLDLYPASQTGVKGQWFAKGVIGGTKNGEGQDAVAVAESQRWAPESF